MHEIYYKDIIKSINIMLQKIIETSNFLKKKIGKTNIDYAIILGSGLGKIEQEVKNKKIIEYKSIPNFPSTSVKGHSGKLIYGKIYAREVIIMSGRFHYYEGLSMDQIVFPVRVFKMMKINKMILSNAAGGVNSKYKIGDIMIIKDHINMLPCHPLRGANIDSFGPRFVDMHEAYNINMIKKMEKIAKRNKINYHKGIYVALQGPTFETPSEYGMIQKIGGDAVGMSTIPEVIIANHMNMKVIGLSIITDLGGPNMLDNPVTHDKVIEIVNTNINKMILLIKEFLKY